MKATRLMLAALAVATLSSAVTACGGPCAKMADFEAECGDNKELVGKLGKSGIKEMCEMAKEMDPEAVKEELECAEQAENCEAYKKCRAEKKAAEELAEIKQATTDKKWIRAEVSCQMLDEKGMLTDEVKKACADMFTAQFADLVSNKEWSKLSYACEDKYVKAHEDVGKSCTDSLAKALDGLAEVVMAIRDGKSEEKVFQACFDYKRLAKKVSPEATKKAEALCDEANAAGNVTKAIEEAKKNLADKKWRLPYACDRALKKLDEIGSDWATKKKADLVDACYKQLGVALLKAEVADMKFCKSAVRKVVQGLEANKISGGEIDGLVAKAKEHCK